MGAKRSRLAATLVRLALAEVGGYPLVTPVGEWAGRLASVAGRLGAEDGWALVRAAELMAAYPDPGFYGKLAAGVARAD